MLEIGLLNDTFFSIIFSVKVKPDNFASLKEHACWKMYVFIAQLPTDMTQAVAI